MNELVTIKNVRGYIDEKGTAFLNLEDVARGLGFVDRSKGTEKIIWTRVEKYLTDITATQVSPFQRDGFIPENIFYKLCMKANNETARRFQDLVCDEILPAIRKDGGYIAVNQNDDETTILARAVLVADKAIKRLNEKIDNLENKNKTLIAENEIQKQVISEFQPIKDYVDTILSCHNAIAITQIAADYGLSGVALNKILNEKGLIRRVNNQWILYAEHLNKGYTTSRTLPYKTIFGMKSVAIDTYWTQKGRLKIHEILTGMGIKANMDK
ncbi:phage antirepressor KilAC domain-containing protein [Fusobacterium sp. SB021]|uniref:phage antirepressor n=1 Tax=Fusobacterium sp. SB021 TaxID=2744227 RepID=UPI003CF4600B